MKDKNGKYITKPRMKYLIAHTIAKRWFKLDRLEKEIIEKIQTWLNEYGFSRKQIFMTIESNFHVKEEFRTEFHDKCHSFCYGVLRDGK